MSMLDKFKEIDPIAEVRKVSRLFNEPTPPKPTQASIAAELAEAIEVVNTLTYELRRVENRLIVLKAKFEGLEVGV